MTAWTSCFDGNNYMVDIESCGEVVLSIGLVHFAPSTGEILHEYEAVLNLDAQIRAGLKMQPGPFLWWLEQSEAARHAIAKRAPGREPGEVLEEMRNFLWNRWGNDSPTFDPAPWLWAYPTSFDLPILHHLGKAFQSRAAWKWKQTMDARTLWQLACAKDAPMLRLEEARGPDRHTALADAKRQAYWVATYLAALMPLAEETAASGRFISSTPRPAVDAVIAPAPDPGPPLPVGSPRAPLDAAGLDAAGLDAAGLGAGAPPVSDSATATPHGDARMPDPDAPRDAFIAPFYERLIARWEREGLITWVDGVKPNQVAIAKVAAEETADAILRSMVECSRRWYEAAAASHHAGHPECTNCSLAAPAQVPWSAALDTDSRLFFDQLDIDPGHAPE